MSVDGSDREVAVCVAPWGQRYIDHYAGGDGKCRRCGAEQDAPFADGWPDVPSLTVTLDGRAIMSAPLMDDRQSFDVGPYKVWITR